MPRGICGMCVSRGKTFTAVCKNDDSTRLFEKEEEIKYSSIVLRLTLQQSTSMYRKISRDVKLAQPSISTSVNTFLFRTFSPVSDSRKVLSGTSLNFGVRPATLLAPCVAFMGALVFSTVTMSFTSSVSSVTTLGGSWMNCSDYLIAIILCLYTTAQFIASWSVLVFPSKSSNRL